MNIKHLKDEDFFIEQGKKMNNLCVRAKGIMTILFFKSDCKYCSDIYRPFTELSRKYGQNCQFAMVNIGSYMNIAQKSALLLARIL